ncbi:hypothetical protein [Micromonospora narathiwatensis]|uniref:Uncharacterized protein n=1 Tax=Micromonospora narathiwatensis TaxID=299146 RepID=A0A1A9A806_9ACTN|nr:hypothetical protein [Micromonospora narathiwatensis]SBT52243.1 hypothetical protein GA0070621_4348 [Micromonospora narathiwatensis]
MSDQPPSDPVEPRPPASSGAPVDPTRFEPPTAEPAPPPGQPGEPAASGQSTPTVPGVPAQSSHGDPAVPAQPGRPGQGDPAIPAQPDQPVVPAAAPTQPGQPVPPGPFAVPGQPVAPFYGAVPGQPIAPGQGGVPVPPGQWGVPGQGGVPTQPGQWGVPGQGAAPGQPGFGAYGGQPWGAYPSDPAGQPQGWAWPAAGGPAPAGAYPGPAMPGQPYGWHPGVDPGDPLVTPPYAGVGAWFARCSAAVRRGWRPLLPIMLLTQAVPAAVMSILSATFAPPDQLVAGPDGAMVLPAGYFPDFFTFYGVIIAASLLFGPLQSTGWAAGSWVITRQAAGEPVGVGAALRYGLRRALGLWGWTLLATLLFSVGLCFCVLPGIYVVFAVALAGPVYLFERENPIGRSFQIFHRRFGMVLGRVALVAVAAIGGALVGAVLEMIGQFSFGTHPMDAPGTAAGVVAVAVLSALLVTPAYLAQLVGLLVTYAEQRAQEGPVNTAQLAAELG